ncbi:Transcription factor DP [Gracilaria domingensis]|nr:Transcription factor DP [Gracilaria domingensis]
MHSPTLSRTQSLAHTPPAPAIATSPRPHDVSPSPSLGIKKRKPRSASLILAANQRYCNTNKSTSHAVPSHSTPSRPPISPPDFAKHSSLYHVARASVASGANSFRPAAVKKAARYSDAKRKGLRHFAIRVSKKVEQKRVTTYNQVADELVAEERVLRKSQPNVASTDNLVDEKNIRRRVYDSLNVLMAMGIIAKDKKLITWQGLERVHCSAHSEEVNDIKKAVAERKSTISKKRALLTELKDQHKRTSTIVERNRAEGFSEMDTEQFHSVQQPAVPVHQQYPDRIGIPFFILSAPKETNIELEMDPSRQDICFNFNSSFAIFDDREVMRRMMLSPSSQLTSPQPVQVDPFQRISFSP